jgi:hypothetical protein
MPIGTGPEYRSASKSVDGQRIESDQNHARSDANERPRTSGHRVSRMARGSFVAPTDDGSPSHFLWGAFPDQMAPIVRIAPDGERELVMARWGMPGPPQFGGSPITNIRNVKSPHWRRWLGKGSRCVVPATSFCEYADTKPRKTPIWFALSEDHPLFAFAGLWTPWRGVRGPKSAPIDGEHELFGFLTTEANAIVAPIHPKACRSS